MNKVRKIKDYYIRYDSGIGLLIYSCKDGLIYGYRENKLTHTEQYQFKHGLVSEDSINGLLKNKNVSRLLPFPQDWMGPEIERLRQPLTINWLITKKCTHSCVYCYAEDVMKKMNIAETDDYKVISDKILKLNPLNVVISGGEPFLSEKLADIIGYLSGKTGIIIDTNGFCYERIKKLFPLLIENNVVIRISIDDLRPRLEYELRVPRNKEVRKIDNLSLPVDSLLFLLKNNIQVTVQTVLTKDIANDLEVTIDRLYLLGVRIWRIFELETLNNGDLQKLKPKKQDFFVQILKRKQKTKWAELTLVYTKVSAFNNNVFLVLPDGNMYTEGQHGSGKIMLNENDPFKDLNAGEHFKRYIS